MNQNKLKYEYRVASEFHQACLHWIRCEFKGFTHAVTLTFNRMDSSTGQLWSVQIIQKATKVFLDILNKFVFKNLATRRVNRLGSVAVMGLGAYGDNPHVHLALACPSHLNFNQFKQLISKSADLTYWLNKEIRIEAYEDDGWLNYMLGHRWDNVLLELCEKAKP